jgi:DNA mismatch repair protein MutH
MARYDKTSIDSIVDYSKLLIGKSLNQAVELPGGLDESSHRGDLGTMVEEYFFEHNPPNNHEPDFAEAGLELKTTGVVRSSKSTSGYKPKERLVLSMINYNEIVQHEWTTSPVYLKCRKSLLLFYLFDKLKHPIHRQFVLEPLILDFEKNLAKDLGQLENDWNFIRNKVLAGKAHELSEGDTEYLGACTKAASSENRTTQPYSSIPAKPRAFSLKIGFLRTLIELPREELTSVREHPSQSIEEAVKERLEKFVGMSEDEISEKLSYFRKGKNHKGFYRELANRMMTGSNKSPEELMKSDTTIKTVRLNKRGVPAESMSFPSFKYLEIVNEFWEESRFAQDLEGKFLFIVFREHEDNILRFEKAVYWSMPYEDRMSAKQVWEETQLRTQLGNYVYPGSRDNEVSHVRPHGRNKADTYPTPTGTQETKRCFWLNARYIGKVLSKL